MSALPSFGGDLQGSERQEREGYSVHPDAEEMKPLNLYATAMFLKPSGLPDRPLAIAVVEQD